jgi:hypothetical protein
VLDVVGDRARGEHQSVGDLHVGVAARDQIGNLHLPLGQRRLDTRHRLRHFVVRAPIRGRVDTVARPISHQGLEGQD